MSVKKARCVAAAHLCGSAHRQRPEMAQTSGAAAGWFSLDARNGIALMSMEVALFYLTSEATMSSPVRILAVGSPAGDDRAGWHVADLLRRQGIKSIETIQNVDDLLGHLSPDQRVILIDACCSGAAIGSTFRLQWPDPQIADRGGVSSHGIDIPYVLKLAEALGRLPRETILYAIEIDSSEPQAAMSPAVIAAAEETAARIIEELSLAGSA